MKHPSLLLPRSLKRKFARRELVPMDTRTKQHVKHALIVAKASVLLVLAQRQEHKDIKKYWWSWLNFTYDYYRLVTNQDA